MFPPQRPVTYRFFRTESGDTLLSIRIPGRAIPSRHVASAIREGPIPESGERLHRVLGHTKAWETGELECDALRLPEPEATWASPKPAPHSDNFQPQFSCPLASNTLESLVSV